MKTVMMAMVALAATAPAYAQSGFSNTYQNEAIFKAEAGAGVPMASESFEAIGTALGSPVMFAGGTITCNGGCGRFGRTSFGATAGQYALATVGPDTITFTFNQAINALGIDVTGLGNFDPSNLVASWNGRTTNLLTVTSPDFAPAGVRFAGIADERGFTSLSLMVTSLGDGVSLDRLQYGAGRLAVPEPATWAMMIVGFGAIGGAMRRKRANAYTEA